MIKQWRTWYCEHKSWLLTAVRRKDSGGIRKVNNLCHNDLALKIALHSASISWTALRVFNFPPNLLYSGWKTRTSHAGTKWGRRTPRGGPLSLPCREGVGGAAQLPPPPGRLSLVPGCSSMARCFPLSWLGPLGVQVGWQVDSSEVSSRPKVLQRVGL